MLFSLFLEQTLTITAVAPCFRIAQKAAEPLFEVQEAVELDRLPGLGGGYPVSEPPRSRHTGRHAARNARREGKVWQERQNRGGSGRLVGEGSKKFMEKQRVVIM